MWPPFPYMEQSLLHTCNDSCKNDSSLAFAWDWPATRVFWHVHHQVLPRHHISRQWHALQDAVTLRRIPRGWPSCIRLSLRQLAGRTTMEHSKLKSIYQDGISHLPSRFPSTRRRIPFSCSETVMLLTVRSDFPIVAAIWFCVAVGFVCTTRSTAISSKVQDLHFRGRLSAKFALWTAPFALWTSSLVSPSFQSMNHREQVYSY